MLSPAHLFFYFLNGFFSHTFQPDCSFPSLLSSQFLTCTFPGPPNRSEGRRSGSPVHLNFLNEQWSLLLALSPALKARLCLEHISICVRRGWEWCLLKCKSSNTFSSTNTHSLSPHFNSSLKSLWLRGTEFSSQYAHWVSHSSSTSSEFNAFLRLSYASVLMCTYTQHSVGHIDTFCVL